MTSSEGCWPYLESWAWQWLFEIWSCHYLDIFHCHLMGQLQILPGQMSVTWRLVLLKEEIRTLRYVATTGSLNLWTSSWLLICINCDWPACGHDLFINQESGIRNFALVSTLVGQYVWYLICINCDWDKAPPPPPPGPQRLVSKSCHPPSWFN